MEELEFDNGWGRSPRLMLRHLAKSKLNQREGQLVRVIEYFTVGWSKYSDKISLDQFEEESNIDKRKVNEILSGLEKKGVIEIKKIFKKDTARVTGKRYRILFDVKPYITSTGDISKINITWSGKTFTSTGDKYHLSRTKYHPQGYPPKTLSKDFLRNSPKKKKFLPKFTEEELERNRKRALEIADELKKKYEE